ncbi:MAG: ATP-binding protein [Streptosporangiaceae bacterium]
MKKATAGLPWCTSARSKPCRTWPSTRAPPRPPSVSCARGGLQFTVTDDGAGFDPGATRRGSGLQGMADRLAALGGTLDIHSRPGHGTTVRGWLPLPGEGGGPARGG